MLKRVLFPSVLYVSIILLSSCGGGNQSTNPSPAASPTSIPATKASPNSSPTAQSAGNKLTVKGATLAKKDSKGKIIPIKDGVFKRGEDIHLVLVEVGKFKKGKDGKNWLDMGIQVKDPKGNVVLSKPSLLGEKGRRVLENDVASSPYGTVNTTATTPPGKYEISLTVYDKVGGGNITASTSFNLK